MTSPGWPKNVCWPTGHCPLQQMACPCLDAVTEIEDIGIALSTCLPYVLFHLVFAWTCLCSLFLFFWNTEFFSENCINELVWLACHLHMILSPCVFGSLILYTLFKMHLCQTIQINCGWRRISMFTKCGSRIIKVCTYTQNLLIREVNLILYSTSTSTSPKPCKHRNMQNPHRKALLWLTLCCADHQCLSLNFSRGGNEVTG